MSSKTRAPNKEVRELIRKVEKQGCSVELLGSGHYRVSKPGVPETVTMSGTAVSGGVWHAQRKKIRVLLGASV